MKKVKLDFFIKLNQVWRLKVLKWASPTIESHDTHGLRLVKRLEHTQERVLVRIRIN